MAADQKLISFRVRGAEVASLQADGNLTTNGDSVARRVIAVRYLDKNYKPITELSGDLDGGEF
jgi:hypothetical protein